MKATKLPQDSIGKHLCTGQDAHLGPHHFAQLATTEVFSLSIFPLLFLPMLPPAMALLSPVTLKSMYDISYGPC